MYVNWYAFFHVFDIFAWLILLFQRLVYLVYVSVLFKLSTGQWAVQLLNLAVED